MVLSREEMDHRNKRNFMKLETFQPYTHISFDLFDTLLIRRLMQPKDLFTLVEKSLENDPSFSVQNFTAIRIASELAARKKRDFRKEVTLDAIYEEVAQRMELNEIQANTLKMLELYYEKINITVNAKAYRMLETFRVENKKIIFISDIYLPFDFIKEILEQKGIMQKSDRLFVSSKTGEMKSTGELYSVVLNEMNISTEEIFHIGDNKKSDVEQAKQKGISALHYNKVFNSRYEFSAENDILLSKIIAASRVTRLYSPYTEKKSETIWNVTSGVSAPLVFFFVEWTIKTALKEGLKKLYFLSRDGQIMYKIAQQIIDRYYKGEIEVYYLYVSRQSLLFPAITTLDDETLDWIMAATSRLTPTIILKRVNVQAHEVYHLLKKYHFQDKLEKHLDDTERKQFRHLLKSAERFLLNRAEQYRQNLIGYFKQEGLCDSSLFGVVDIGWSGTLQRSISRVLELSDRSKIIHGFYFGLKRRKQHKETDQLHAWFTDHTSPCELDKKSYIIPMTELFTAADHGGVIRHKYQNGRYIPILKNEQNSTALQWGLEVQHEAMLCYTENILHLQRSELESGCENYTKHFEDNYAKFLLDPSYDEASAYGSYLDAEDQNESYHLPLARAYTEEELVLLQKQGIKHHHNEWHQGALKLTLSKETG
jgi:predicted HAD superfamily hydrolase